MLLSDIYFEINEEDEFQQTYDLDIDEMCEEKQWRLHKLGVSEKIIRRLEEGIICYSTENKVRKITKSMEKMIKTAESKYNNEIEIYHCIKSKTPRGIFYYLIYSSVRLINCCYERKDMKYGIVPAIIVDSKNEMKKSTICVAFENGVLYRTDGLKFKNTE